MKRMKKRILALLTCCILVLSTSSQVAADNIKSENAPLYLEDVDQSLLSSEEICLDSHDHSSETVTKDQTEISSDWNLSAMKVDILHEKGLSGKGIKVAIFDSGINTNANIDLTGGISFVNGINSFSDDNGHGTNMAAVLSSKLTEDGFQGIAPNIDLYSVKILDKNGEGKYSSIIKGINWAIENNINIITFSFSGFEYSKELGDAIKKAEENNILLIAAAGNAGGEEISYPAAYPEVVAVGATDSNSDVATFSNYGDGIDVYAPGDGVVGYNEAILHGTSVSTQEVAGIAALLWDFDSALTNKEVRYLLKNSISAEKIIDAEAALNRIVNKDYSADIVNDYTSKESNIKDPSVYMAYQCYTCTYGNWVTTSNATCTTSGSKYRVCVVCGNKQTSSIPALGHNMSATPVAATCTLGGYILNKCTRCSVSYQSNPTSPLGHSYGSQITQVPPTCTADGTYYQACSRCGNKITGTLTKLGHNMVAQMPAVAPTCTASGYTLNKCSRCTLTTQTNPTSPLGHSYGSKITQVPATCTTDGTYYQACSRCGNKITGVITALGHDMSATPVAATCTQGGYILNKCSRCTVSYQSNPTSPLGHSYGPQTTRIPPTCTADGTYYQACTRCGNEITGTLTKLGHNMVAQMPAVAPTCTLGGYILYKCSRCTTSYQSNPTPPTGHSYGDQITSIPPTCTTDGTYYQACKNCGDKIYGTIPKQGHNMVAQMPAVAPTCTLGGYILYKCSRCTTSYQSNPTPPTGHSYGDQITSIPPTCTTDGTYYQACKNCGDKIYGTIPKQGHNMVAQMPAVPSTCKESGYILYKCSRCTVSYQGNPTPPTGHSYGDPIISIPPTCTTDGTNYQVCKNCGDTIYGTIPKTGHTYDNNYIITRYPNCMEVGYKHLKCINCTDCKPDEVIPKTDHVYATRTPQPATCEAEGFTYHYCIYTDIGCTAGYKADIVKPLGHIYKESVTQQPTETKTGIKTTTCDRTGCKYSKEETMPVVNLNVNQPGPFYYNAFGEHDPNTYSNFVVTVNNDYNYTVTTSKSWVHTSNEGSGFYYVSVDANESALSRDAVISISSYGVTRTINVWQAGALSCTSLSFDYKAGIKSIEVDTSASWTAEETVDKDWLTLTKSTYGVDVKVTENPYPSDRSATINIKIGTTNNYVTVTQKALDVTLTVTNVYDGNEYYYNANGNCTYGASVTSNGKSCLCFYITSDFSYTVSSTDSWVNFIVDGQKVNYVTGDDNTTKFISIYVENQDPASSNYRSCGINITSGNKKISFTVGQNPSSGRINGYWSADFISKLKSAGIYNYINISDLKYFDGTAFTNGIYIGDCGSSRNGLTHYAVETYRDEFNDIVCNYMFFDVGIYVAQDFKHLQFQLTIDAAEGITIQSNNNSFLTVGGNISLDNVNIDSEDPTADMIEKIKNGLTFTVDTGLSFIPGIGNIASFTIGGLADISINLAGDLIKDSVDQSGHSIYKINTTGIEFKIPEGNINIGNSVITIFTYDNPTSVTYTLNVSFKSDTASQGYSYTY